MPSSLLMVMQSAPQSLEPLPAYTRRDSDTSSIRSSAPSYVSEAPTYHSTIPNSQHHRTQSVPIGLPPTSYAPGFHRAPSYSKNDISHLHFNISEWSAVRNGSQARHYQNVANRRASLAAIEEKARLTHLASTMTFPSLATIADEEPSSSSTNDLVTLASELEPVSPLEDPDLVGVAAATAARERRLYMTKCRQEQESMKHENKSWDFQLNQMADWHERNKSWDGFKRNVEGKKLLGNKFLRRLLP